jgi:hypothetical protein
MINNLGLYSSAFNNSSAVTQKTTDEVQALTEKYAEKSIKTEESGDIANNIFLSSKAQKISAISSEFFSGNELTFDDIDRLKEKLYQFGLISKGAYAGLTSDNTNAPTNAEANENTSTTTLTGFIGNFIERLNEEDVDEKNQESDVVNESVVVLIAALNTAKNILANVEEQKHKTDFKSSLQESLALLKQTISDKSFSGLPLDDQIGLSKVYQALEIVDHLSPKRLNNNKVNQYIQLSFR